MRYLEFDEAIRLQV